MGRSSIRGSRRQWATVAAASLVAAVLVVQYGGSSAGARPLSAPTFSSKAEATGKQGAPLSFTIKTQANPTATVSYAGALPPGMTFTPGTNGTATLSDSTPLGSTHTIDLSATNSVGRTTQDLTVNVTSQLPRIRHVFVIMLENEDYRSTFGNPSADPYLAETLPSQGAMLKNYYATGHYSNDNYVGFISGQPPNGDNQLDCIGSGYANFSADAGEVDGIQQGDGCVYPSQVTTLASQLDSDGLTWKGYEEDMGNDPSRDGGITCGHPALGSSDPTTFAAPTDGYTTRHNPFMYFHSIIDDTRKCDSRVVPLGSTTGAMPAGTPSRVTGLVTDLKSVATTPNFSFITPNLCDDGHDYPCTNTTGAGQGGGSAVGDLNKWLSTWVPIIEASPAYQRNGLIEITFDEAETPHLDTGHCCGEIPGPAAANGKNGIDGPGGGIVGAVLLSPFIHGGTVVHTPYNHYSSLASIEDLFGLPRLGEAQTVKTTFDKGIYNG